MLAVLDQIVKKEDLFDPKIQADFKEELGDLLMQVVLHAEMTRESGAFDFYDVARALNEKLIRRHPHVFGEQKVDSADRAIQSWEKQKSAEKGKQIDPSILAGLPQALPALQRSYRLIDKVTKVGFQWPDWQGPLAKIKEELAELEEAITAGKRERMESEIGDLLFSVCNLAYAFKVQPEDALRAQLGRFEKRFRYVERRFQAAGRKMEEAQLTEMDEYWNEAKVLEQVKVIGLTGGIGAGKSTVAEILRQRGYPVIDADQLSRRLIEPGGKAARKVESLFGTLDRSSIRARILAEPELRHKLESIVHPLIARELIQEVKKLLADSRFASGSRVLFYEAALLVETGRYRDFYSLWTVEADEDIRIHRITQSRGLERSQAEAFVRAQTAPEERMRVAAAVIKNQSDLKSLESQITDALSRIEPSK